MICGQIFRIHLKDFMSYSDIEFRPGFHLNLIVGPNGTGKSTIVCAVILGLGGKLKTLGRADHLNAYVKNGCHESIIEIELYDPSEENVLITRKIFSNGHSEFYINNKASSASKVNEIRKKYNIQIDNLCSFLPQEKVQDFAKLNQQQLLDQTQRTIGNETLLSSYEQLIKLQGSICEKEKHIRRLEEQVEAEKEKNERLRDKVNSFLERRALCDKMILINQKKSWLSYHNELVKKNEIVQDCKLAEDKFAEKKKQHSKLLQELRVTEAQVQEAQKVYLNSKSDESKKITALEELLRKLRDKMHSLKHFENNLKSKLGEEENKRVELKQYMANLDKLKNDLKTFELEHGTDDQIRSREREIEEEIKKNQEEASKLKDSLATLEDEGVAINQEIRNISMECRLLEKKKNYRLEYIKRYEPDLYKSLEWLKDHKHLFQGIIYNPMLLELDVTDVKMAKYVEARIGYRDLISFTCTNPDDLNLLIQKLRIEQKLKVNAICSDDEDLTQYSPEIPLSQIKPLGFFAYLKDLITGPDHIIRYLCKVYRIHCIPIGTETVKSKCDKVPVSIPIFFSENHMFLVKLSIYSGEKLLNVKQLNEPKLFSVSLDSGKLQLLNEKIHKLESDLEKKEVKVGIVRNRLATIDQLLENARGKKRNLAITQEDKKQILIKWKRTENNVRAIEQTLRNETEIVREADAERKALKGEFLRHLRTVKDCQLNVTKSSNEKHESELVFKTRRHALNEITEKTSTSTEELTKLQETVNTIKKVEQASELKCRQLQEAAEKLTNGVSPGQKAFEKFEKQFRTLKETVEELESELQEIQMMADFLQGGNAQVVQEFQNREEEIAKLMATLERFRLDFNDDKRKLESLRDSWILPVTELVSTINKNFGRFFESMGCAGEISLVSAENKDDFAQYGIAIKVKFRDEVPLQNLDRHFQSGGERAVATAVYMLSLQELMSVPFRFVDEINQGMDSANERRILELMIRVTAQESSTQYFFITPKLLHNVECSEKTTVHCIYSGPRNLSFHQWSLDRFLE